MRLAAGLVAGMTFVLVAFVRHLERDGGEVLGDLPADALGNAHVGSPGHASAATYGAGVR